MRSSSFSGTIRCGRMPGICAHSRLYTTSGVNMSQGPIHFTGIR
jgi:hypothetical protein